MTTERLATELEERRRTVETVKENYAVFSTEQLRSIFRSTQLRAQSLRRDLASGAAAKSWRYSGDLTESLRQVEWKATEQELVAEGVKALIDERDDLVNEREDA